MTAVPLVAIVAAAEAGPLPWIEPAHAVRVTRDMIYGEGPVRAPDPGTRPLLLDLYEPDSASARRPAFVAVHGGGLTRGTRGSENMAQLCEELTKRGYVCVSIDYRLHGDDPPGRAATSFLRTLAAATDDAGEAVRWLVRHTGRYRAAGMGDQVERYRRTRRSAADGDTRRIGVQLLGPGRVEGLGHVLPLDRRPGGVSLYDRLAAFLWREMDLAALTAKQEADRVRAMIAAIPHPLDDEAAIPCPK